MNWSFSSIVVLLLVLTATILSPACAQNRSTWTSDCINWVQTRYDSLTEQYQAENAVIPGVENLRPYQNAHWLGRGHLNYVNGSDTVKTEFVLWQNSDFYIQIFINVRYMDLSEDQLGQLKASGLKTGWTEVPFSDHIGATSPQPCLWVGITNDPYMGDVIPSTRSAALQAIRMLKNVPFLNGFWVSEYYRS